MRDAPTKCVSAALHVDDSQQPGGVTAARWGNGRYRCDGRKRGGAHQLNTTGSAIWMLLTKPGTPGGKEGGKLLIYLDLMLFE